MIAMSTDERRRRLSARHFLTEPAAAVEDVAVGMVGLHSSDPVTVYLSARARVVDFTTADLERALYEDRSLLRMLGMRRTLFVVPHEVAAIMDAACASTYRDRERTRLLGMLEAQGLTEGDPARWLAGVEERTLAALVARGQATAVELTADVPELGLKIEFGAGKKWGAKVGVSTRVLFLLATGGRILRGRPLGTWISSQYRWAPTDRWLGGRLPEIEPNRARETLLTRWLRAFGPGTVTDMKWWTGWGVGDTRACLAAVGAIPVELEGGETGFVLPDGEAPTESQALHAALLPALDATVMGWKQRSWYLGAHEAALFDGNGNAGPTIWFEGRVVGGWGQAPTGEIRTVLLEDVGAEGRQLVAFEAEALRQWLGEARVTPRFRTPLEQQLREA